MPLLLSDRAVLASPLPLVTAREARLCGIRLDPAGHVRVRSGIYVPRRAYLALRPWQRYAVRVHAFARAHPDAVLCLESAAVVHGLPSFGEARDIHVYDPARTRSRRFGDVCVHTSADGRAVERHGAILVTALPDTVIDLLRVVPPAQALAIVDASISPAQGGGSTLTQLQDLGSAQCNGRGSARLSWAWSRADPRAESPAESLSRAVIEWRGYEEPELQRTFHYEGALDRVDFHFRSARAIGEADGWGKYQLDEPEKAAERLRGEKRREDRLRRHGHPFARWELGDVWRVTPLERALNAAQVSVVAARQNAMLATLRHRPREVSSSREKPRLSAEEPRLSAEKPDRA
ncbi:hypothetical protein [Microbacterium panaciterrae]|uniref:Transcriptional regulator, AbiEi antitoxin, Type IV TA system n=1 Tax=Microbacterium panaciterrae TaxID=985759 RepID=A0ABP8PFN1_9MICO